MYLQIRYVVREENQDTDQDSRDEELGHAESSDLQMDGDFLVKEKEKSHLTLLYFTLPYLMYLWNLVVIAEFKQIIRFFYISDEGEDEDDDQCVWRE